MHVQYVGNNDNVHDLPKNQIEFFHVELNDVSPNEKSYKTRSVSLVGTHRSRMRHLRDAVFKGIVD
jgi:hypothetical protein